MALFGVNRNTGKFEIFGYVFERGDSEKPKNIETFAPPANDDGASELGFNNYLVNFDQETKNEALLINRYRMVSLNSEFDRALNDIVNETISFDDEEEPIKLDLNSLEIPDSIKQRLHDEFDNIMQMLDFKHEGHEIFKRWYVDGRLYFHKVIDTENPQEGIKELRYIDPRKLKKVREEIQTNTQPVVIQGQRVFDREYVEYYLYNDDGYLDMSVTSGIRISTDSIAYAHSGLQDPETNAVISYMHKALRPFTQLRTMEDSVVVAKFTRAPQRRAFYVDVGNLNRQKSEQYLQETMRMHRSKLSYDSRTGEFRSDRKTATMIEDYWFPKRGTERSTEIETLTGDNTFADMTDVDYFRKKLYESLNVPVSRLESNAMFNLGRSSEITRDEVAFQHFIHRIRNRFNALFLDLLKTQLILKGVLSLEDWEIIAYNIEFVYGRDNFYSELKNIEILRERLNLVSLTQFPMEGLLSRNFILSNIMQFTDEEIKQIEADIAKEKPETDKLFGKDLLQFDNSINKTKPFAPNKPKIPKKAPTDV